MDVLIGSPVMPRRSVLSLGLAAPTERRQAPLTMSSWALEQEEYRFMEKLGHLLEPTISLTLRVPAWHRQMGAKPSGLP